MRGSSSPIKGFTLVEVAMSLGLIGVALAAIFAVLGAATDASKDTGRDTVLVSMTTQILDQLHQLPFEALGSSDPVAAVKTSAPGATDTTTGTMADTVYYFGTDGNIMAESDDVNRRVYQCTVKKTADEDTRQYKDPLGTAAVAPISRIKLEMAYEWPVQAPAANRKTKKFYASIARY